MSQNAPKPWLCCYASATAVATLFLICVGGLVTSHEAGLSVPDWPTTYGYNMFFFPFSKWMGGVFYEHSHRLVASAVGLMTVLLAFWLWLDRRQGAVLRWLGLWAVVGVVLQGVLGGLRVTALLDELGIVHATLAQLFLALVAAIALLTSPGWKRLAPVGPAGPESGNLRRLFPLTTGLILVQLIIGATMRHQHAGLAIPDFPLAYGSWWPDLSAEAVARYNAVRLEVTAPNPITAFGIVLQMGHRLMALVIVLAVGLVLGRARKIWGWRSQATKGALLWLGLIAGQVLLGAATIWTGKSADIATAHVGLGAATLVAGVLLSMVVYRLKPAPAQTITVCEKAIGLSRPAQGMGV